MHYRLCAEQGHKIAQNNLGNAYYLGDGVARDPARAAYWFEKAAAQGHADAQCDLVQASLFPIQASFSYPGQFFSSEASFPP